MWKEGRRPRTYPFESCFYAQHLSILIELFKRYVKASMTEYWTEQVVPSSFRVDVAGYTSECGTA